MNLFTRGMLAVVLAAMTCVAASADEVKVEIPKTKNITMTITAESIEKVSDSDGKAAFAVIHMPVLKFSSPLILDRAEYKRTRFFATSENGNVLCNVFGFGAYVEKSSNDFAPNNYNCEVLAGFKGDSREIIFRSCGSNQSYWRRVTCAIP